jgi:hypothetical protein
MRSMQVERLALYRAHMRKNRKVFLQSDLSRQLKWLPGSCVIRVGVTFWCFGAGALTALQWMIQLGVSCRHDVACLTDDAKPSGILCLNYSTSRNNDNLYGCANGINDAKYAYNNVQEYDLTWYYRFNAKWHTATETW